MVLLPSLPLNSSSTYNSLCGNTDYDLSIIQGDVISIVYQFLDVNKQILTDNIISHVYMTCERLNYQNELVWNPTYQGYQLDISSDITINFPQCLTNYDLTVEFIGNIMQTEIYEAELRIFLKRNKVVK